MENEPLVKETDNRLLYNSLAKKNNANAENTAKKAEGRLSFCFVEY